MYAIRKDGSGVRGVNGPEDCTEDEYFSDILPEVTPSISREEVDAERDRRANAGVTFKGVLYQTRPDDRDNISGAALLATMAITAGALRGDLRWHDQDSDFVWIAADNSKVPMDAYDVVELGKLAATRKQALIYAGRDLKDMAEIPADFTDDKWWPA